MDVELEAVGAERQAVVERGERVFRRERAAAAMREHERPVGEKRDVARQRQCLRCTPHVASIGIESDHGGLHPDPRRAATRPATASRPVKQEIRDNLVRKLQAGETLFPGIIGYDDTVVPQLVNAILSRHNFILLGLRGQAKSRILRGLVDLLDEQIAGRARLRDSRRSARAALRARAARASRAEGDALPIAWLPRDARYVEKLATPDVTIADMVGDIDPIKAAQAGLNLVRRADDALRPAAAGEPRHLRDQRAAGSRRQDSGRPVQHPAGRRRPD